MTQLLSYETQVPSEISPECMGGVLTVEDDGAALILELTGTPDDGTFIRVQSWDERAWESPQDSHELFKRMLGKQVRITVEVFD